MLPVNHWSMCIIVAVVMIVDAIALYIYLRNRP